MQITPSVEYQARFKAALGQLGIGDNDRIMLAVSGGPDSLAMLMLAHQLCRGRINAATVDHELRPESAAEAQYVSAICADLGISHVTLKPRAPITGNIQSSGRAERYALLQKAADEHRCDFIATAHQGDDQLETILMRLARGSGLNGLAAVRSINGRIIRPLLSFSKSELEKICADAGIIPVRDPSNDNANFDRVAMRQWLNAARHPFDIDRTNRSIRALGDAVEALAWVVDKLSAERITETSSCIQCDASHLPVELKRRLLLCSLSRLEPDLQPRGEAIDHLLAELDGGRTAMIGDILCTGGAPWEFRAAPPRRTER